MRSLDGRRSSVLVLTALAILAFLTYFYVSPPGNLNSSSEALLNNSLLSSSVSWWSAAANLKKIGCKQAVVTDKITGPSMIGGHQYHFMYGTFLMHLRHQEKAKMLEIGLGCGMDYGAGASANLWRNLLPNVELWEAEIDQSCLLLHAYSLREKGVNTLHGDQSDLKTLHRWLERSGGEFDAIIDDGSHRNSDLMNTFDALWPSIKPGGVYFMEDLQVGRATDVYKPGENYEDTKGTRVVSDVMQSWIEQKLIAHPPLKLYRGGAVQNKNGSYEIDYGSWENTESNHRSVMLRKQHPIPLDVAFIFCQAEACAVGKEPRRNHNLDECGNAEQSSGKELE
jgi:hypothetical protein